MAKRPGGMMTQSPLPTRSQLIPIITKWPELAGKSQLVPMIVTILFVLLMYTLARDNRPLAYLAGKGIYTSSFIIVIAVYLNLASLFFIYRLAGKSKSWLLLLGSAVFTLLFMSTPIFDVAMVLFHRFLAGGLPTAEQGFMVRLYKYFVAAGLFEELTKALPILILWWLTRRMTTNQKRLYGVQEPLDGILIGAGSAAGFAIYETVGQYVSNAIAERWIAYAGALTQMKLLPAMAPEKAVGLMSDVIGCAPGIQLAIPRSLDQAFGHMAYAGYFGYFIGLAVMKPEKRWQILGIGLFSAAFVHALWNATPSHLTLVVALIAVASYAVLAAAILKAREISPTRAILQPSIILAPKPSASSNRAEAGVAAPQPPPVSESPDEIVDPVDFQSESRPPTNLTLRIGTRDVGIASGVQLSAHDLQGLSPQVEGGPVAEIRNSSKDPSVFGMKNFSSARWEVFAPSGRKRPVEPGQIVRLTAGTLIDFGAVHGRVL